MAFNILLKAQLNRLVNKFKTLIRAYATSSTAKDVVDKVATLDGFILAVGQKVTVKFTDTSATSPSSGNITLNVNSTGAKTVISSLDNTTCTYEDADNFCNNKTQQFIYDGTYWVWLKGGDSEGYTAGDGIIIANNEIKANIASTLKFSDGKIVVDTDKIPNKSYLQSAIRPSNYLLGYNLDVTLNGITFNIRGNYVVMSGTGGENITSCVYSSSTVLPIGKYKIITNVINSSHPISLDSVYWVLTISKIGYSSQDINISSTEYDIEFEDRVRVSISIRVAANYDFGNVQGIYEISLSRILTDSSTDITNSDLLITTNEFGDLT